MNFSLIKTQYRDYCLIERGITAKAHKAIVSHMTKFLAFLATENIRTVKEDDVREYLFYCKQSKNWSPRTFRSNLQSIKSFYDWCLFRKYVSKNPAVNIHKPKIPKSLPRCLTKEQAKVILSSVEMINWDSGFGSTRNLAIIGTFMFTGIRLNELLHLQLMDVNMYSKEILIREGKGKKQRIVPIHKKLEEILRYYLSKRKRIGKSSQWFFTGVNSDKRLYEKNIHQMCERISVFTGIKFTPHMLRHTFARLACDENINLFKLKEIMGHTEISTTQIYLSVSKEGIKDSMRRLELI